ncbi:MAG: hypothetical protein DA405_01895 [Bacteroidetes bacterium]|nr:MAG: hypothetical protein DA405_01895 [Bacteroidota bacterium]
MYITLLKHQWRKTTRSSFFRQGWGVKILMTIVALYFLASFGALGYFAKEILNKAFDEPAVLTPIFMGFVLYYLLVDLVMRFFLQDLTVLTVQHYLVLPIAKSKVINYLLGSSIFSFFNLLPLFLISPWAIRVVAVEQGPADAGLWFLALLGFVFTNHFLAIYVKRVLAVNVKIFGAVALVVALAFLGDFMAWFSLTELSKSIFGPLGADPLLGLVSFGLMALIYLVNFRFLLKMTHLDRWKVAAKEASSTRFSFLEQRGPLGLMMANELKLITRNKRTKTILWMTLFFSAYGLIFYTNPIYKDSISWLLFVGIFMTGIFLINYGQFLVSWESAYFDGILTRAYAMEEYYKSKYYLLAFSAVIMYVLTLPYGYFGIKAIYINTACFIYNVGVNTLVLIFASTYNKKPIDLSRGSAFNYQGTGAAQFLIIIPLMVVPMLMVYAFDLLWDGNYGLIFLALLGLIGILSRNYFIKQTVLNFQEKKYINAAGYRQRD